MKNNSPTASLRCLLFIAASATIAPAFIVAAESAANEPAVELDRLVVTANRMTQPVREVASAVTVFTPGELATRQIYDLGEALREVPGVSVLHTGGSGGVTYFMLRGSKSSQTLFLVDGVRFNDPNTSYTSWLGGFSPGVQDRVEVLRGPQSTLYGGAAMGGVVSVALERGAGAPSGTVAAEGGSFATGRVALSAQGTSGALAYALTASALQTDNDRADNEARLRNGVLRLDYQLTPNFAVGGTFRHVTSHYKDPNDIRTINTTPISNNDTQSELVTLFAEGQITDAWNSRIALGWQTQNYANDGSFFGVPSPYATDTKRHLLDWQNTVRLVDALTLVVGANYEKSAFNDGTAYPDDKLAGAFAHAEWQPVKTLNLGAGVRYDDYDSFGETVTARFTLSQNWTAIGTRLHATWGTSFVPPSLTQRYGSAFTAASPGIQPEESTGWDLGIEQTIGDGRVVADATYFKNRFKNLIAYQGALFPALGSFRNLGRANAQGVETSLRVRFSPQWEARASWTWLEAEDGLTGARLDDRPKHTFSAALDWRPRAEWQIGASVQGVNDRLATDYNVFPSVQLAPTGYTTARVYASWQVREQLTLRVRAENVLNQKYEETYGFPANGAALFFGAEWKF